MSSQKKYLVLHGYRQSGYIIEKKLKGLLGKNINLVTPNGPLIVDEKEELYGWFPLELIDLINGNVEIHNNNIRDICKDFNNETYDGVIAFSQGCLIAALLVGKGIIKTNKLLLFSPIPVPDTWSYTIPSNKISAKIYIGLRDDLVHRHFSMKYISALTAYEVGDNNVEHRWGHVIPSTSTYKNDYVKFLTS